MSIWITISDGILAFTNFIWGYPAIIFFVIGGIFLTIRIHWIQITKFGFIIKHTIGLSFGKKSEDGKHSGWQAFTGALASNLGNGTMVGAGMAIALGGPGAIFWMWVCGIVACAIKYGEVVLAMKYRTINDKGEWAGGPQYYLPKASGLKWLGPLFAVVMVISMFLSASAQIGAGVDNVVSLGANRTLTTAIYIILAALIVLGGMNRLLQYTEKVVPIASVLYIIVGLIIIVINYQNIPTAFYNIFRYAFTGHAAFGGFAGATLSACIRWGLARGIYSNNAGVGMTTISHSVADVNHPAQQGMWGMFDVIVSTLVLCTISGLTVLVTDAWQISPDSATLTLKAFEFSLGNIGAYIFAICLVLFTFTSGVASLEFGVNQFNSLIRGRNADLPIRILYLALMFAGGMVGIEFIINYMDFFAFLLFAINMPVIYMRHKEIHNLTSEYFADPDKWETTRWPLWVKMRERFDATQKAVDIDQVSEMIDELETSAVHQMHRTDSMT